VSATCTTSIKISVMSKIAPDTKEHWSREASRSEPLNHMLVLDPIYSYIFKQKSYQLEAWGFSNDPTISQLAFFHRNVTRQCYIVHLVPRTFNFDHKLLRRKLKPSSLVLAKPFLLMSSPPVPCTQTRKRIRTMPSSVQVVDVLAVCTDMPATASCSEWISTPSSPSRVHRGYRHCSGASARRNNAAKRVALRSRRDGLLRLRVGREWFRDRRKILL